MWNVGSSGFILAKTVPLDLEFFTKEKASNFSSIQVRNSIFVERGALNESTSTFRFCPLSCTSRGNV